MMGHLSGAYTARISRDLSLSSRFDFNIYSYDSEWTMGAEWWMRRPSAAVVAGRQDDLLPSFNTISQEITQVEIPGDVRGVVKARASTNNVSLPANHAFSFAHLF
jgi:mitochondrial distribution and morphology protein 10